MRYVRKNLRKRAVRVRRASKPRKPVAKLARKVQKIARVVSAVEKKRNTFTFTQPVGQVNQNGNGYYCTDVTPMPSEGNTITTRNGSRISLMSLHYNFQIAAQGSLAECPTKLKFMLISMKGFPYSAGAVQAFPTSAFSSNLWINSAIVDYNSMINPDYRNLFSVVATKTVYLPASSATTGTQPVQKSFSFGHKFKRPHVVRFNADSATLITGQLLLVILADTGNMSTTSVCTLTGVEQTAINTGVNVRCNGIHYFTDM